MARTVSARAIPRLREQDITTVLERPVYQAYEILHVGYSIIPILMGVDKYFHLFTDWSKYLYYPVAHIGLIEIVIGVLVALSPRVGGYLLAIWLWIFMANLILLGVYYDIALLYFGLSLGALALARLSREVEPTGN